MSNEVDAVMSTFHMVLYATLGLLFVLLGGWRMRNGMSFKPAGLAIGLKILIVITSAQLGIVSLDGVGACMKEKSGGRSKILWCLFHVRMAAQ
jgi:hypothetical protein